MGAARTTKRNLSHVSAASFVYIHPFPVTFGQPTNQPPPDMLTCQLSPGKICAASKVLTINYCWSRLRGWGGLVGELLCNFICAALKGYTGATASLGWRDVVACTQYSARCALVSGPNTLSCRGNKYKTIDRSTDNGSVCLTTPIHEIVHAQARGIYLYFPARFVGARVLLCKTKTRSKTQASSEQISLILTFDKK